MTDYMAGSLTWWHVVTVFCVWVVADAIKDGLREFGAEREQIKADLERERFEQEQSE